MILPRATGVPAYLLSATCARTGDEMVAIAVVILVLHRTGSPPLAGAIVAAYTLPAVLSGPLLGAWLDRTRARRGVLASGQLVLAAGMLGLVTTLGTAPTWTAPAMAALVGVTVPMISAGFTSHLPRFIPAHQLPAAHAIDSVSLNLAAIVGPASAATIATAVSPAAAVQAIPLFAAVSLLALGGVPAGDRGSAAPPAGGNLLLDVRRGLTHVALTPPLRGVTAATTVAFVGVGALTVVLPLQTELLAGRAALGGYAFAAFETGAIAAALLWARWHTRWRPERVVLATLAASGIAILTWTAAGSFPMLLVLAVVAGLAAGAGLPALLTTRQRHTPAGWYGQVAATGASFKLGAFAVGAALAGQLAPLLAPVTMLTLIAVTQLLAAATGRLLLRTRQKATPG